MQLTRSIVAASLLALLACLLAACGSTGMGPIQTRDDAPALKNQVIKPYTLGSADRLRITVFGHQDLSGEFEVDGSGAISMPLIGQVSAVDLTTQELEKGIAERLADGYILNPRVSAEVINYRPFYILGEVGRPGEYPYTNGLTVQNAVAAAGGFTYRANKRVVYIKSADATNEVPYELSAVTIVKPGDTLRIGERIF